MELVDKKYNIEASLSTAIVVLLMFLLVFFVHLSVPDPPIDERGGGPEGKGKMMTLAFAPTASENPSITPKSQPQPEEKPQEQVQEEVTATPPEEVNDKAVISDEASKDVIKASDKKKHTEPTHKKPTEDVEDKPTKPAKKQRSVNINDLFSDGDEDGGGDPNGNSDKGTGNTDKGTKGIGTDHSFGENGWNWSKSPRTDKTSKKNGEIVFNVDIDENGKVTNVSPKRYTVDYELMQSYQEECYKLKFVRKNDIAMSGTTRGTITFRFKAR
ncbi:MAG TPA: hypothetical protein VL947_06875 [Cytophagales bacterium]|nr:hypothetical protein [Cytophagales bacterium]